jgi:uncharacterized protein
VKRRLRKKRHLREFQELGFRVVFRFTSGLTVDQCNDLEDRFVLEAIEAHSLVCGGGGSDNEWDVFVTRHKPGRRIKHHGSATEAHREAVEKWLQSEELVLQYYIGPLVDGWYGRDEDWFAEIPDEAWNKKPHCARTDS